MVLAAVCLALFCGLQTAVSADFDRLVIVGDSLSDSYSGGVQGLRKLIDDATDSDVVRCTCISPCCIPSAIGLLHHMPCRPIGSVHNSFSVACNRRGSKTCALGTDLHLEGPSAKVASEDGLPKFLALARIHQAIYLWHLSVLACMTGVARLSILQRLHLQ